MKIKMIALKIVFANFWGCKEQIWGKVPLCPCGYMAESRVFLRIFDPLCVFVSCGCPVNAVRRFVTTPTKDAKN